MASRRMATLLVCYGGQLQTSTDFVPTYYGGENTVIEVPVNTKLADLKLNILSALNKDLVSHTCELVWRLSVNNILSSTTINNDGACKIMLKQAVKNTQSVYVTLTYLGRSHQEVQPTTHVYRPTPVPFEHFEVGSSSRQSFHIPHSYEPQVADNSARHSFHIPPSYEHAQTDEIARHSFHVPEYFQGGQSDVPYSSDPLTDYFNQSTFNNPHSFEPYEHHVQQTPAIPEEEDEVMVEGGYETMETDGEESSDEDRAANTECNPDQAHELIRNAFVSERPPRDEMIGTNEYVQVIRTAQEWDAVDDCDNAGPGPITEDDDLPAELYEGMIFMDKSLLQYTLMGWSIRNNVEYRKTCSNKNRLSVKCIYHNDPNRPCPWRVHATYGGRRKPYWELITVGESHSCTHPVMASGHKNLTSKFISNCIGDTIRKSIDIKPREIIARIDSKFNVRTSYHKAWDARKKAISKIFGSFEESYASLYRLMEVICLVMPGSVYRIQVGNNNRFWGVFWCFAASIESWSFCRPVLSLDGTFLLGKYRGTLLAAVGHDADGGLLPVAFAIVESESTESWSWFLQALLDLVGPISSRQDLCIISDKHPGLVRGCREILPWVTHVHCLRHLRENFKKFLRTQAVVDVEGMCNRMYNAGNTDDERQFNRLMREIEAMKKEAHDWLIQRDITKWSLVHDGGSRYGSMTTNSSESFNSVLKKARGLPIQGLILSIYYKLINLYTRRSDSANTMVARNDSIFTPKFRAKLHKNEQRVRQFPPPQTINAYEFQVFDSRGRGLKVEIKDHDICTCSCNKPQIYHFPCVHAIVAFSTRRINHENFVSKYYTVEMYAQTYKPVFHFIPDRQYWPEYDVHRGIIPIIAPRTRRQSGRPRVSRIRNTMDENRSTSQRKCGTCNEIGHNSATCPRNTSTRSDRNRRPNRPPPC